MFASRLRAALWPDRGARISSAATSRLVALLWLPFGEIAIFEHGRGGVEPLLRDLSVHVRILIGIPLFALSHQKLVATESAALSDTIAAGQVDPPAAAIRLRERLVELSHAPWPQALVAVLAIALAQLYFWGAFAVPSLSGVLAPAAEPSRATHGPAGVLYAWLVLPLFYFFALRVLYDWALWCVVLVRWARLPLRIVATHPDRSGGLGYVVRPSLLFSLPAATASAIMAAAWANEVLRGVPALRFRDAAIAWAMVVIVCAFAPLLCVLPKLFRLRVEGLREYGRLAAAYTRRFHARWIGVEPDASLLGTPDIQALNDLGGSFGYVVRTRLVPFGIAEVAVVGVITILPMLPLALTAVPTSQLLKSLVKLVF